MGEVNSTGRFHRNPMRIILFTLIIIPLLLLCILLIWRFYPRGELVADPGGPYTIGEGQSLVFDGSGSHDGTITSYTWDFGDGQTGSGISPSHTYQDGPAQYTVTLTVADDKGQTTSATTQVTVNNLPPTAEAGGPYTCEVNQIIPLSGQCDDLGPIDEQSLSCTWADFSGAVVTQPNYTCPATPGQVTLTLITTDKDGASAQDTALITVTVPPTQTIEANPDGPYTGMVNSPISFNGSGSGPANLIGDYIWDFGDGHVGHGIVISYSYTLSNTYDVTLTVTGIATASGQVATGTTIAIINPPPNAPPVAVIQCPPYLRSKDGRCLYFDGSRSFDPDPDGEVKAYAWDFNNDGTIDSTEPMAEYCYPSGGSYILTLTVTDDKGAEHSSTIAIEIF